MNTVQHSYTTTLDVEKDISMHWKFRLMLYFKFVNTCASFLFEKMAIKLAIQRCRSFAKAIRGLAIWVNGDSKWTCWEQIKIVLRLLLPVPIHFPFCIL